MAPLLPLPGFEFVIEIILLLFLLIIGLIVIVVIAKAFLFFLPAVVIAIVVWFLTGGSWFWAGVAFLIIAVLSITRRR